MNYYYLVASLPRLLFGAEKLPIHRPLFEERLRANLAVNDFELYAATIKDFFAWESFAAANRFLKEYALFEKNLRNFLISVNMKKIGKDFTAYAAGLDGLDPGLGKELVFSGQIIEFIEQKKYFELERFLGRTRFEKIDELNRFHYFDIDRVLGYSFQLAILERWAGLGDEQGTGRLRELSEKDIGKKELYQIIQ